eukprot:1241903-Heterocapsa_arctica.AAC.2
MGTEVPCAGDRQEGPPDRGNGGGSSTKQPERQTAARERSACHFESRARQCCDQARRPNERAALAEARQPVAAQGGCGESAQGARHSNSSESWRGNKGGGRCQVVAEEALAM